MTVVLPNFHRFSPTKGGWKVPKGQTLKYQDKQGYYTAPITTQVKRPSTSQNQIVIETPAQIEARVTRMAQSAYDRQKSDLDAEVEKMKKEAEGRRLGMIAAYKAAGDQNATMAGQVQAGWNTAADTLQGLAGTATGGIGDALRADTAAQEAALARIGASPTGFDATGQQAVEQYRGGILPSESFIRSGGIANEYLLRMPDNLKRQGLATATADEREALAKVDQDRLSQVRALGESRVKYEEDLRSQLLKARSDQMDAINASQKLLSDIALKRATLNQQYAIAKMNATTKKEMQAVEMIYKNNLLTLKQQEAAALNAQRNAAAGLSIAKTNALNANPSGSKTTTSQITSALGKAQKSGDAIIQTILDNIWAAAPGKDAEIGSDEYNAAVAWNKRQQTRTFKTAFTKVVRAVSRQLKAIGYKPLQVQQFAWDLLVNEIDPPAGLRRPGAAASSPAPNIFSGGIDLNPGNAPGV